jgi:DNA end-binding protein Ku
MRSLWTGVLSFGLVSVPVRLYAATSSQDVHLRYLHAPCVAPVQYRKVCSACGAEVTADTLVLGYESAPDTFVVVDERDLDALPAGPEHTVEIERFVPVHSVDPLYLAKAYYLEPQVGGHKAYQLLHRAMADEARAAVVRISLRRRERWALVRAGASGVLHLETLLDADEVRSPDEVRVGEAAALRPGELELARDLVRTLAADFRPEEHPDRYRRELMALIERKLGAGEAAGVRRRAESGRVIDLMAALRASLDQAAAAGAATTVPPDGAADHPPTAAPAGATAARKGRGRRARTDVAAPPPPRPHARTRGGGGV